MMDIFPRSGAKVTTGVGGSSAVPVFWSDEWFENSGIGDTVSCGDAARSVAARDNVVYITTTVIDTTSNDEARTSA